VLVLVGLLVAEGGRRLATGKVTKVEGGTVYLDVGAEAGIKEGTEFEIWRPARVVVLPLATGKTREIFVEKKVVARVVVRKVLPKEAVCEVISGGGIKEGYTAVEVEKVRRKAKNVTPYIDAITTSAKSVAPAGMVDLRCRITDADDVWHVYEWEADGGLVYPHVSLDGCCRWVAPAKPGKYHIKVTVRDAKGAAATKSVEVIVRRPEREPASYRMGALFGYARPPFMEAADIAVDDAGRLVLLDRVERRLVFFDRDGMALRASLPAHERYSFCAVCFSAVDIS